MSSRLNLTPTSVPKLTGGSAQADGASAANLRGQTTSSHSMDVPQTVAPTSTGVVSPVPRTATLPDSFVPGVPQFTSLATAEQAKKDAAQMSAALRSMALGPSSGEFPVSEVLQDPELVKAAQQQTADAARSMKDFSWVAIDHQLQKGRAYLISNGEWKEPKPGGSSSNPISDQK
jgi:hypothetical protein